jgi:hypothetical protein
MSTEMSWPPFADADDVSAFESTPLETRLAGNNLLAMFRLQVERDSGAPAIVYVPDGIAATNTEIFSRQQLLGAVQAIAHDLTTCGIQANDVIASLLPNGPGTIAASLAGRARSGSGFPTARSKRSAPTVQVPTRFVDAVREKLAALPFRSQADAHEQKEM